MVQRSLLVALALIAAAPALAAKLPSREPGLWETRAVTGGRYKVIRRCFVAGEPNAIVKTIGLDACKSATQRIEAGYLSQVECRAKGLTMEGRMQIAGDFTASVQGRTRVRVVEDATGRETENTMLFTSRRIGECGPGE